MTQLSRERSDARRGMLERLFAQEEARLSQLLSKCADDAGGHGADRRARISVIVEQLQLEIAPATRAALHQRLIEEEDRFGRLAERLDLADAYIEDGVRRVATLEQLAASVARDDVRMQRIARTLSNSREILQFFKSYRASLEDGLGRIGL